MLRALAAASGACMRALLQSNCVDTCLTVLDRADPSSKIARTAALLLHDVLDWDAACRSAACQSPLLRCPYLHRLLLHSAFLIDVQTAWNPFVT